VSHLRLTVAFGERDRVAGAFLGDAIAGLLATHEVRASALLRGALGYGPHHALRTDRLLTLSEDPPMVALAADERSRIHAVVEALERLSPRGLVATEEAGTSAPAAGGEARLTAFLPRGSDPHAAVERLHAAGAHAAAVLLGVDGTAGGTRHRARFRGGNADVPLVVLALGPAGALAAAGIPGDLDPLHDDPAAPATRITVVTAEDVLHAGRPLHEALVRAWRAERIAGATALRGVYGFHRGAAPRGDTLLALRRRVPVVVEAIVPAAQRERAVRVAEALTGGRPSIGPVDHVR
jgi:PII-like signaling protein